MSVPIFSPFLSLVYAVFGKKNCDIVNKHLHGKVIVHTVSLIGDAGCHRSLPIVFRPKGTVTKYVSS